MSKAPPNDTKTRSRASEADNPLAALVAEFDDSDGIEVSPAFRPLKESVAASPLPETPRQKPAQPSAPERAVSKVAADPQPVVNRTSGQTIEDQIDIPARSRTRVGRKAATATASASAPAQSSAPKPEKPPAKKWNPRGLMAGAAALVAIVGAGFLYLQGSPTASSETVVYEVPVFDDDLPTSADSVAHTEPAAKPDRTATPAAPAIIASAATDPATDLDKPIEVAAVATPQPAALPVDPPARLTPLGFDEKFSDEFPELEGQSLLDLATGIATFAPLDIVPDSAWDEVSCGGCHGFNQANLCEQGAYYFNHDKTRIARIQHPYGGGFKQKLMEWAEGGCQ